MPLREDLVEAGKNAFGDPIIFCSHCHQPANYTQTVNERGTAVLELMCPAEGAGPTVTLGSWPNEQQRSSDIRQFLQRRRA
jgi:hypothetical protein